MNPKKTDIQQVDRDEWMWCVEEDACFIHGEWLWNTCATIYVPSYHPVSCLKVSPAPGWAPLCVKSPAGQTSETPWDRADSPLGVNLARSNFISLWSLGWPGIMLTPWQWTMCNIKFAVTWAMCNIRPSVTYPGSLSVCPCPALRGFIYNRTGRN